MGSVICTGALEMSNSGSRIQLLIYSPLCFFKSTMPCTHLCLFVCTSFQVTSPKSVNIFLPGNTVSPSLNSLSFFFFFLEGGVIWPRAFRACSFLDSHFFYSFACLSFPPMPPFQSVSQNQMMDSPVSTNLSGFLQSTYSIFELRSKSINTCYYHYQ